MSGIMSNIQYMPSPHGVSKRIRLHHNELFSNPFQGSGQYGYPYKTKEQDDIEVHKTTHVWMRNCQFKEERNAFLLECGRRGKLNESSTSGSLCLKENIICKDLVSQISKDNLTKPLFSKPSHGTFKDTVVQSLNFLGSDLESQISKDNLTKPLFSKPSNGTLKDTVVKSSTNTTKKETVKPYLVSSESNLRNVDEDSSCLSTSLMEIEPKFASTTQPNGTESFPSSTVSKFDFKAGFKDKLPGPIDQPINEICSSDHLDISKKSSTKYQLPSEYQSGTDETKTLKYNQYEHDTSKDSSVFSYGYENPRVKCMTNSREYNARLEGKDNLCRTEKASRMIDITIEGLKDHKVDDHNLKESNIDHKLIKIGNSLNDFDKVESQDKNGNLLNPLNSGIKVLPWKTYAKIVKRLPDYKVFSNVIQKAMKKVKHPKIDFEPISLDSNTTLSAITENVKVTEEFYENCMVTEELHEHVKVTEDLHENCMVTEELHENVKVTKELHENVKVTEELHCMVTEEIHENCMVSEELHENCMVTGELNENVKVTEELHENCMVTEELHENFKVTEELHENCTVTEELNENCPTKSKQDLLLLHDLEEWNDFLDYASGKIQEMILLVCSTSQDIQTLEADSEGISIALHHIRSTQYIAGVEGKMSIEDTNAMLSTRNEMLKLGDYILQKIDSLELSWMTFLAEFKRNLVMVSRCVYMLCSIPIENKLTEQRDLAYAAMQKVDDQIMEVEVKERDLNSQRDCKFSELLDLQGEISRFNRLDTILDELCQKSFD